MSVGDLNENRIHRCMVDVRLITEARLAI